MRIILFNGPPRCGKDTAAKAMLNNGPIGAWKFDRMSMPLKLGFAGMIGLPRGHVDSYGNVFGYEEIKEQPLDLLGVSYRQFQIDMSEKFLKPLYGQDIFGRLFIARNNREDPINVLVPDCGFQVEAESLAKHYGSENMLLIRIGRDGCDFSKDSRGYIDPLPGMKWWDISNNDTIENFIGTVKNIIARWINQ